MSGDPMTGGAWPVADPNATGLHRDWYAANVAAGELTAQRCECGTWRLPCRYRCAQCHSDSWGFVPVGSVGTLRAWTVTHRPLHGLFAEVVPYAIGIVDIDPVSVWCTIRPPESTALDSAAFETAGLMEGLALRVSVDSFGLPFATPSARQ